MRREQQQSLRQCRRWVGSIAFGAGALASTAHAQACDSVTSRTSLSELAGRPIRSISIETREPTPLPFVPALLDRLHVRTRDATIRRMVLVFPGDALDTLRIAESLRRLRQLRYLSDPAITGTWCGEGPVDLTVVTQDLWSVKPSLQVRSASQALSITERNVFGSGREASIGVKSDEYGVRLSAGLRDPWFLGRDMSLDLTTSGDGERGARSALIQKRERSVLDPLGAEARIESSAFSADKGRAEGSGVPEFVSLRRLDANALISRRVRASEGSVLHLVAGAEYDALAWETPHDGAGIAVRQFVGPALGFRQRSVAYDTVTWVLPAKALVDVPLSFEFDALAGIGRDLAVDAPALHADVWAGKLWLLGRKSLVLADAWGSGFYTRSVWSAATLRGGLNYQRAATRGVWSARVGVEHWFNPDPDLHVLVTADPTYRALGDDARRTTSALTASIERSLHVRRLTRSYTLDVAGFAAASRRDSAEVAVIGLGVRLAPARLGRATARLDFGFPVLRSGDVNRRPFVSIGLTPWLEQDRQRDGRRMR